MLIYDVDKTMEINETYYLYVVIQSIHVICTFSVLFVVWSNNLFDRWSKIDQSLLILFLSVIGIWIWYLKYFPKYKKFEKDDLDE